MSPLLPVVLPSRSGAPRRSWPLPRHLLPAATLLSALLVGGCPKRPIGPDNHMALLAFSQCRHHQALVLTEAALARGDANTRLQALLLRAAILQERDGPEGAAALYPDIDAAWQVAKRRPLKPERRAQEIALYLAAGRNERQARGLDSECRGAAPSGPPPATPVAPENPGQVPQREPAAVNPALPAVD